MTLTIIPATLQEEATFRNLFQFYLYEFSQYIDLPLGDEGRFDEDDIGDCWSSASRHPFFLRVDGALAGLAIIDEMPESFLSGEKQTIEMREFFVIPAFRRQGIGTEAATRLFDRFRGRWEVYEHEKNSGALPFWRKVISAYTHNAYREQVMPDKHGIVQFFDNSAGG